MKTNDLARFSIPLEVFKTWILFYPVKIPAANYLKYFLFYNEYNKIFEIILRQQCFKKNHSKMHFGGSIFGLKLLSKSFH